MKWGLHFDRAGLEKELHELECKMQEPGFWDDSKRQKKSQRKASL